GDARAHRPLRLRRPIAPRAPALRRATARSPGSTRRADPLRTRRRAVAARGLPDRIRAHAWQRRDAERGAAIHTRAADAARGPWSDDRADNAPYRRLFPRAARAAVPRAISGFGGDRTASGRGTRVGWAGGRCRDDGGARA